MLNHEETAINTQSLQLDGFSPQPLPYHPPCIRSLPDRDRHAYGFIINCMEHFAILLKDFENNASNNTGGSRLSKSMQRRFSTLFQCTFTDEESRRKLAKAARSIGERIVIEFILRHQNPQQVPSMLWAAVRARGCQFLGPALQEEVLRLILLALEDGSPLSRSVLVMFVVQRLEQHFFQVSKTSIGHVVQLLYRASCFNLFKRESDSSLMQLKSEFRAYEPLRREHDVQIVQISIEAGLRITPDQLSALLYGDSAHSSYMQSIISKLQSSQSFSQSLQDFSLVLKRKGDSFNLTALFPPLEKLASIDTSQDAVDLSLQELSEVMKALKDVTDIFFHYLQQYTTTDQKTDTNHKRNTHEQCIEKSDCSMLPRSDKLSKTNINIPLLNDPNSLTRVDCTQVKTCTLTDTDDEREKPIPITCESRMCAALTELVKYPPPIDVSLTRHNLYVPLNPVAPAYRPRDLVDSPVKHNPLPAMPPVTRNTISLPPPPPFPSIIVPSSQNVAGTSCTQQFVLNEYRHGDITHFPSTSSSSPDVSNCGMGVIGKCAADDPIHLGNSPNNDKKNNDKSIITDSEPLGVRENRPLPPGVKEYSVWTPLPFEYENWRVKHEKNDS